jgi:threonine dehydrogenase-like Zn-dependent dehydrogenase
MNPDRRQVTHGRFSKPFLPGAGKKRMKAIAIRPGQKNSVFLHEIEKPEIAPGELLIRVLETGICGTDLEIIRGDYGTAPRGQDFLVLGHESFGRVEEVGPGLEASGWATGDYVVCTVRRPCHDSDPNCDHGQSDMCLTGNYTERGIKDQHGFMTEYYTEKPQFAIKVPPQYRSWGVLLEPTAVVEKAIYQAYKIQQRLEWAPKKAVVLGAGPIGLLATFLLRDRGLEVFTVAHSPGGPGNPKAVMTERVGATYLSSQEVQIDQLNKKIGPIDLIIEASGSSEVVFQGMAALGPNGIMGITGVAGGHNSLAVDTNRLNHQIVMGNQVIFGSVNANRNYFEMGVESWAGIEAKWPGVLDSMITRKYPLEDYEAALSRDRNSIKTVMQIAPETL